MQLVSDPLIYCVYVTSLNRQRMHASALILFSCVVFDLSQNLSLDERADMPSCNLVETVHNRWLQQSGNQMTCLYEATVDDLIHAFM